MKTLLRTGAGLLAAASLVATPMQASAQANDYDPVLYNLLLDCTTLQILFAQVSDAEASKKDASAAAVGFLSAAQTLSGAEVKDLAVEVNPRKAKILAWLDKKDPAATRLAKSCAAIMSVGKNAAASAASR